MAALYDSLNAMFTQIATDVKALFSGKVNKSGDTLTGNLVVNTPVESKVSVAATGKPDTQLYANANTCGLYALDAGFFTHYDRVANKKYVWGVDFGTVVLNNAGTYGINISGSASAFNGQAASYYTDIPSRLGYTPVQQGTGVEQGDNAIKIGWSAGTAKLKATVDNDDLGNIAFETWVAQQLANLVASSPASLDTLNELAAALNNDPNFATTMIDALANKVNRAGDTFTGNVYIDGDSGPHVGVTRTGFPPAYLFSNSDYWGLYSDATGGEMLVGYQRATGKSYFADIDSALIVQNNGGTYGINITGNADTVDGYHAANLMRKDEITFSTGTNGCYVFPPDVYGNKLILQWGYNSLLSLGNRTIIFPTVFLHTCFGVQNTIINNNASGNDNNDTVSSVNQYGFTARSDGSGGSYWFALGY